MTNPITSKKIIAIDGHSSTGKSTLAKAISKKLGFVFIDSGAMYRAVTLFAIQNQYIENGKVDESKLVDSLKNIQIEFVPNSATQSADTFLNGENVEAAIRTMEVSNQVSTVSSLSAVRRFLVEQQQSYAHGNMGLVMDGRDIGTVVFPQADLKVFMTASPEVRAKRRFEELKAKGKPVDYQEVYDNLMHRDYVDSHRDDSPLTQADDAKILDNSHLSPEQQLEIVLNWI